MNTNCTNMSISNGISPFLGPTSTVGAADHSAKDTTIQRKIVDYSSSDSMIESDEENENDGGQEIIDDPEEKKDDSDSNYSPKSGNDSYSNSSSDAEEIDVIEEKGKRRTCVPTKRDENKKLKLSGKAYLNYKNKQIKEKKVLPNPCAGKTCGNNCNSFTEEERHAIFELFWKLRTHTDKRGFINGCVNIIPVKRKRTRTKHSRRNLTYQYFMMKGETQTKVCLQFLLSTLNITQKLVRSAVQGKIEENRDRRGIHAPKHKITNEQKEALKRFFEGLPAVPSHYCRSSTAKLYLPSEIKTITNLHTMYVSRMTEVQIKPVSITCFKNIFKRDYNMGIHVPRKDKCAKCEKHKNIPEERKTERDREEYLNHQKEKDEAKRLFLSEQSRSTENRHLVASFDLQKVLATPHGPGMLYGFSRKYAMYNFTVYESKTQNGYCYLWGEKDGKRGVNEICSNLYSYLMRLDEEGKFSSISLFCDNCPGQNKNRFIPSMLLHFLKKSKTIENITVVYLVAGHTYMPVDSVHAVIEKYVKNMNVQAPSEWSTLIRNARRRPRPYDVINLNYSHFYDWKSMSTSKKLKTSSGTEVKISSMKAAKFSKGDIKTIQIFTNYELDNPITVEFPIKNSDLVPRLYFSNLPICNKKLKNLLDLCEKGVIKDNYHVEYFTLNSNASVPDTLPESDIEDLMDE